MWRIAIFTDDPGWHGKRLKAAFARRGCEARYLSLSECRFDLSTASGMVIPGFEPGLPDAVFVRGVAGGTLEQVVLRLDFLHALKECGVPVYNSARAIEKSVDKAMTSFLLKRAGLPTPPTWVFESPEAARALALRETGAGRELVIKPLFGSQGVGLKRVATPGDLPPAAEYDEVHYLQRFIDLGRGNFHDYRVFVVNGEAVGAMIRRGQDWIINVAQGGRCEPVDLAPALAELAEAAVKALDMDYGGVDLLVDAEGRPWVVEVNSIPAWRGLQKVVDFDLAQCLVDDLLARHLPRRMEAVC